MFVNSFIDWSKYDNKDNETALSSNNHHHYHYHYHYCNIIYRLIYDNDDDDDNEQHWLWLRWWFWLSINQPINKWMNEWMNEVGWMVSGVLGGSTQQKRSDAIFDRWMQVWYSFQKSIATYRPHRPYHWLRTTSRRSLLFPTSSLSSSTNEWMNEWMAWLGGWLTSE